MVHLLFDIGATKTRVALANKGRIEGMPSVFATPKHAEQGVLAIVEAARSLTGKKSLASVGGGVAGVLNAKRTMLASSPNMPGWVGAPIAAELERAFGVPVKLENDAALAALGEAMHGAGKEHRIVAYLTISTGIGGARIVNRKIDPRAAGFEPGHQIISFGGGGDCGVCGAGGCFEGLASGTALKRRYGKDPAEIKDPAVWHEIAETIAVGVHNTIVHWSPDIVVLGGSMICGRVPVPIDEIILALKNRMKIFAELPGVRKSALGDSAGLWGALAFASAKK